ncbi:hypothetical protein ABH941_000852 [Streptacidiphilus sp. EB103A]
MEALNREPVRPGGRQSGMRRTVRWLAMTMLVCPVSSGCSGSTPPVHLPPPADVTVTSADDKRTVDIHVGEIVAVTLPAVDWVFPFDGLSDVPSADPSAVLRPEGSLQTRYDGSCRITSCPGTVTMRYSAIGVGQTTVKARKLQCGEARPCPGTTGLFSVTVLVLNAP